MYNFIKGVANIMKIYYTDIVKLNEPIKVWAIVININLELENWVAPRETEVVYHRNIVYSDALINYISSTNININLYDNYEEALENYNNEVFNYAKRYQEAIVNNQKYFDGMCKKFIGTDYLIEKMRRG
jgi:hypothetical protein